MYIYVGSLGPSGRPNALRSELSPRMPQKLSQSVESDWKNSSYIVENMYFNTVVKNSTTCIITSSATSFTSSFLTSPLPTSSSPLLQHPSPHPC